MRSKNVGFVRSSELIILGPAFSAIYHGNYESVPKVYTLYSSIYNWCPANG